MPNHTSFLRPDGIHVPVSDWQIDPDMPTAIIDAPLSTAKEYIAKVSTPDKAEFILRACHTYDGMRSALEEIEALAAQVDSPGAVRVILSIARAGLAGGSR